MTTDWRILPLADRPEAIPTLAIALWDHWGAVFPQKTVAYRIASLAGRTNRDRVPLAVVAIDAGGAALGMASIMFDDLEMRIDLNPWLATVFVIPSMRGKGLGEALCAAAEAEAWRIGIERLYLYTFDKPGYYARLGWRDFEIVDYNGRPTPVMVKDRPAP